MFSGALESNIDLHLQCEQQFLNLVHAFNHTNYSRWGTFEHIYLWSMEHILASAYQNVGFTAFQSGSIFNWVHGDYICKNHNAETKVSGGCIKARSIKNTKTFNTLIRTKHIAAM